MESEIVKTEELETEVKMPEKLDQLVGDGIRIATYNVGHFNNGNLGGYQGEDVIDRMNIWKEWISSQNLDILALNEWNLYFDNAKQINASDSLLCPSFMNVYFGTRGAWVYNGICTNFETDQSSLKKIVWDKSTYNAITVDIIIDSISIKVISTHMPWQVANHENALKELIEELKKFDYFICMGDMNASDKEQLAFIEHGFNIANGGDEGFFKTYEGRGNVHLDNIITSSNIEIIDVACPHISLNKSDHYPLEAIVRLVKTK